eukprot:3909284-Rhodomonas_salina.1
MCTIEPRFPIKRASLWQRRFSAQALWRVAAQRARARRATRDAILERANAQHTLRRTFRLGDARMACARLQVKRLSIAVELLGNPSIILLDEPTSGLDSAAAEAVMRHLVDLAKSG